MALLGNKKILHLITLNASMQQLPLNNVNLPKLSTKQACFIMWH